MASGIFVNDQRDDGAAAHADKTKVFVSYSRHDAAFVAKLVAALASQPEFQVFQDTADILPSEEWRKRLTALIGAADTIVFCLSPSSVTSEVCAWEVELSEKLNKRIIPIMIRNVLGQAPGGLAKLNYIFFTDPSRLDESFETLVQALQTDIGWIREHSRIGELSRRWEATGKRKDLLLRGAELQEVDRWARVRPANAPPLTEGTSAYIDASHEAQRAIQRATRGVQATIFVLLLGIIGGLVAYINRDYLREKYTWYVVMRPAVLTAAQERQKAAKPGPETAFSECANGCPTMVVVAAGTFMMGSPEGEGDFDERPQHEVTIAKPFAVSRTEITFAEWAACVAASGCPNPSVENTGPGDLPVANVNWSDVSQYAAWLSKLTGKDYRLLTEAEWEHAARAGNPGKWSFGDNEAELGEHGWSAKNSGEKPQPVARKTANAFGLHDMHGNVWEWVQDCYDVSYVGAPNDGSALASTSYRDCSYRPVRGGSWDSGPRYLSSASRGGMQVNYRLAGVGFRLARTLTP